MQRYTYKAKSKDGKTLEGKIEARDTEAALSTLREKGMFVISVKKTTESGNFNSLTSKFQKVSLDDTVAFTRQLSTMMSSGLSLTEALSILESQSKDALAKVIGEILREVQAGSSVADAMAKHSDVFPGVYISLVRAGEAAGALDEILKRLATNLEKQKEFRAKTRGALIYPAIVSLGMVIVTIVMMVFVIPKLAEMYEDFDADLPLTTQILISSSNIVSSYWYVFIIVLLAGGFAFRTWRKTPSGALKFDKFMVKIPVFGPLKTQIILAEVSRTMSLLIGAGISLIESLEIVEKVVDNQLYKQGIRKTIAAIKKGIPFSASIANQDIFPAIFPNMIAVGEETGKLDEVLLKVSTYFEEEAENLIKNLTTALEPLIMIVLGIGVGFLVISIIMPIYNLTNQF